jgi:hypothetical protein
MELQVIFKSVYGTEMIYPACDTAKKFLTALGLKTFTPSAIAAAKAVGCTFKQVSETKTI